MILVVPTFKTDLSQVLPFFQAPNSSLPSIPEIKQTGDFANNFLLLLTLVNFVVKYLLTQNPSLTSVVACARIYSETKVIHITPPAGWQKTFIVL